MTDKSKKIYDHKGQAFESKRDMCSFYGIKTDHLLSRLKLGWSLEDALETPVKYNKRSYADNPSRPTDEENGCWDHEGNYFVSKIAKCRYYHIPFVTYGARIRYGWSEKKALTTPVRNSKRMYKQYDVKHYETTVYDHQGNPFNSLTEMCEHYKIPLKVYIRRIKKGCSIEQALTTKYEKKNNEVSDHLGNTYPTQKDMCEAYGISSMLFRKRIQRGLSVQEALTGKLYSTRSKGYLDHKGNDFSSLEKMCNHYHVSVEFYRKSIEEGRSLKEIFERHPLTKKKKK